MDLTYLKEEGYNLALLGTFICKTITEPTSISASLYKEPPIELTGTQVSLIERVHAKRRVSTYDDYVLLANLLIGLYNTFSTK